MIGRIRRSAPWESAEETPGLRSQGKSGPPGVMGLLTLCFTSTPLSKRLTGCNDVARFFWAGLTFGSLFWLAGALHASDSPSYLEARKKFDNEEYLLAMLAAQKAVEERPNQASYRHLYGLVLMELKQFNDSRVQLREAVTLDPNNAEFQYSLGAMLVQEKKERLAPGSSDEQLLLLWRMFPVPVVGTEEETLKTLKRAVELDPNHLEARLHLGRTYYEQSRHDLALQQFRAIAQKDPSYSWIHYHLSVMLFDVGSVQQAIEALETEVRQYPDHWYARLELGELLEKSGRLKMALGHLVQAEKERPDTPDLQYALAKVYRGLGETEKAIASVRKCIELDAEFIDAYYLVGQLYRENGQPERARSEIERFERLRRGGGF